MNYPISEGLTFKSGGERKKRKERDERREEKTFPEKEGEVWK